MTVTGSKMVSMKSQSQYLSKDYQKQFWATNKNARGFDHPVVEFFARQRIDYVRRYIDLAKVRSAFDVGCGDGFATHYFAEIIPRVEGGDISELMLEHNPIDRGSLQVIDAEDLDLPDGAYELVYMWEVLHHLKDPARAVQEMARVSKRYVVIFEPNRAHVLQFLFGLLNLQERGTLRSSKAYLQTLTRQAGLQIIACDYCGKIPPNKTPRWLFEVVKRLPFRSSRVTGISVAVIAQKVDRATREHQPDRAARDVGAEPAPALALSAQASLRHQSSPREESAACTSSGTMPIS
jgi:SAM-dependent methyltransferase